MKTIPNPFKAALIPALLALTLGCTTGHGRLSPSTLDSGVATGGSGGLGGSAGSGGAAGTAGSSPACAVADPSTLPGRIGSPNPLISVGKPVASSGVTNAAVLVDGKYTHSGALFAPTDTVPAWAAIDLGTGPSRLLLMWTDDGWSGYNNAGGGAPFAYNILTSADSTNGVDGVWTRVAAVTNNPVRAREHSFDFSGQRWVKLEVIAGQPVAPAGAGGGGGAGGAGGGGLAGGGAGGAAATSRNVVLDEIAIYDMSASDGGVPTDTWFFLGDSITQGAFMRNLGVGKSFDEVMHAARAAYFPVMMDGGVGGEFTTDGVRHVVQDGWLDLNPDMTHVGILYGTNDSWGGKDPVQTGFEATMESLVSAVLAAHRFPILAPIPYASKYHTTVPQYNAIIERIRQAHGLPCGPDLYGFFANNPDQLQDDGVHPTSSGYVQMNKLWADAAGVLYPPG
jgi:acyl-CoA thioesterase I